MDHARSADAAVQAQLDRLTALSPGADVLGLGRIRALLDRLDNPERRLPPVFHVAGTNGKGSTCAFLRAALEAENHRVHVYTSPHLVRFNERIRIAGTLIEDQALAPLLARVLDAGGDIGASFFEVTTAAALLAFAETWADACVIEVGLGGRLDATNVIPDPAVCGIAQLGLDHQAFLGDTIEDIAREKSGIAKGGRPLVVQSYPPAVRDTVRAVAAGAGADLLEAGDAWTMADLTYRDQRGRLTLPLPTLPGAHQIANLALATAMLRHQDRVAVSDASIRAAATRARWPARMQRLGTGPLVDLFPPGTPVWLDGGHNEPAARAVADTLAVAAGGAVHLIIGMLANKDAGGFLAPLASVAASLTAVPVPGHDHHAPGTLATLGRSLGVDSTEAGGLREAISRVRQRKPGPVAIVGSLYLAGEALRLNDELPN